MMKRVVSISLGSSRRNKRIEAIFCGVPFTIERIGTDGDMKLYRELVCELDGKVDAFGVGGADIFLYAGPRRYIFREPLGMMAGAKRTPFVDGSGLKHTLERTAVETLDARGILDFRQNSVLLLSAVDRFGMAEALAHRAHSIVFGDILFGIGLPVPIRSFRTLQMLARLLLPIIVRLPFQWFYPTGQKQEENRPRHARYFARADIIAGDFLLIARYMPQDLRGKVILTNTTTDADVSELRRRGVHLLVTTTPVLDGRSFGTNVMEAVLITLLGKRPEELNPEDYTNLLDDLGWEPAIQELNPAAHSAATPALSR